jgi:hypothetical protein
MKRFLIVFGIPGMLAALVLAAALLRPRAVPAPAARDPRPAEKTQAMTSLPHPAALAPTPKVAEEEKASAVEEAQIRMLVRRLREAAVQGNDPMRQAMIEGLKKWKGSRAVLEEEIARTTQPREAQALREAMAELR